MASMWKEGTWWRDFWRNHPEVEKVTVERDNITAHLVHELGYLAVSVADMEEGPLRNALLSIPDLV